MANPNRQVTEDEIDAIAAKLGPAFTSLTKEECEAFSLVMQEVIQPDAEVSGFGQSLGLSMETLGNLSYASPQAGTGGADRRPLSWFRSCRYDQCCQPGGGRASSA